MCRAGVPAATAARVTCGRTRRNRRRIVWEWLRNRRFGRWKFRRQHPVGRYVLDFYCALRLAIEIDGDGHEPFEDDFRSAVLARWGIRVKRLRNDDVVCRPNETWERLISVIDARHAEIGRTMN